MHDQRLHMYVSEADRRNLQSFLTLVYLKHYDVINIDQTNYVHDFKGKVKVKCGLRFFSELAKVIFAKLTKQRNQKRPLPEMIQNIKQTAFLVK